MTRFALLFLLLFIHPASAAVVEYWACGTGKDIETGSGVGGADSALPNLHPGDAFSHAPYKTWTFQANKAGIPQNVRMDFTVPPSLASNVMRCVIDWSTPAGPGPQVVNWNCGVTVVRQGVDESTITGRETGSYSSGSPVTFALGNVVRTSSLSTPVAPNGGLWDSLLNQPCQVANCIGHKAIVFFYRDTTVGNNVPNDADITQLCVVLQVNQ